MADTPGLTNYFSVDTPAGYVCTNCGSRGHKLWREYNTFLDHTDLYCVDCAGANSNKDVSQVTPDGKVPWWSDGRYMGLTDSIGWLVPAVPTENGDTYWGYTSVPDDGVKWWQSLPV